MSRQAKKLVILGTALLVVIGIVAFFIARISDTRGASTDREPDSPIGAMQGYGSSGIAKSIGDEIVEATLIARVEVVAVGAAEWNSPDGSDWSDAFLADPENYGVSPMPFLRIDVKIGEIYLDRATSLDDDAELSPAVENGDQISGVFLGTSFVPGDERVLFLRWTNLNLSDGSAVATWAGDEGQGTWTIDGSVFTPVDTHQAWLRPRSREASMRTSITRVGRGASTSSRSPPS